MDVSLTKPLYYVFTNDGVEKIQADDLESAINEMRNRDKGLFIKTIQLFVEMRWLDDEGCFVNTPLAFHGNSQNLVAELKL